jgi:UDP-N-acetylglucosamine--N-acetylmuramyl-(pentapeptide) pyrophosphoryl-undecaprenol N-acetylglucosamine transferase
MSSARYVLAGGGTGGHLFPGLAVARALRQRDPDCEIVFFTTTRRLDGEVLDREGFERVPQSVRPFSSRPWHWPGFWWHWRSSVRAAGEAFQDRRPSAVLGLGGYAAGPPVVAARSLGVRTAILNPDAVPGRANRYLARHADLVVLQWETSRKHFPPTADCRALGCPIRADFRDGDRGAGCRRYELDPRRPVLLVTGASQGARTVNQTVQRVWPEFQRAHPDWQLLHLTGPADEQATRTAYAAARAPATVLAFTHEMPAALAAADLVVSRAGASTLAELSALGKPSILFPYPYHRDRHQHVNAGVLTDGGAAVMIEDSRDADQNAAPLLAALRRLVDPVVRKQMSDAAQALARPDAAESVAAFLAE